MSYRIHQLSYQPGEEQLHHLWHRHADAQDKLLLVGEAVCLLNRPSDLLAGLCEQGQLAALAKDLKGWNVQTDHAGLLQWDDLQWVKNYADAKQVISW